MKKVILRINDTIIGNNIEIADNFLTRLRGLMFRKELPNGCGLLIYPCNSIHMFCMNFPIDVLFVNKQDEIIDYLENFEINKVSKIYPSSKYVVELPAGTIKNKNIKKNQKILLENY